MAVPNSDAPCRRLDLRLGLLNGLLSGLALALGVWASDAIFLALSHVRLAYPSLLAGSLALGLLGGLGGWLAAWAGRAWASALIWLIVGGLMTLVIGHVPYEGRTLTLWLADPRSWGLPIYPFSRAAATGMMLAGFFILLLLGALGLLQPYRLEGLVAETDGQGRLRERGRFLLVIPLPLVIVVGLFSDNIVNKPLRLPPQLVHEAIRTGRTYPGDLFDLSLKTGINYNALSAVRDRMSEQYDLSIGMVDLSVSDTVLVVAEFDNGTWILCRVVAEQISFCYDAGLPYTQGLPAFLTSGQTPPDCLRCAFTVGEELRALLQARQERWHGSPRVTRLARWGGYVLVRAESPGGEYAVECLFRGFDPVHLEECRERSR